MDAFPRGLLLSYGAVAEGSCTEALASDSNDLQLRNKQLFEGALVFVWYGTEEQEWRELNLAPI